MAETRIKILTFPNGDTLSADLICGVRDMPASDYSLRHAVVMFRSRDAVFNLPVHGTDEELDAFIARARDCHASPIEEVVTLH